VLSRLGAATGILVIAIAVASAAALATRNDFAPHAHVADADDIPVAMRGRSIYAQQCASCHGRNLQGQPLWQLVDKDSGRRAPALDLTGRTWTHSDEDVFLIVKYGRLPGMPADRPSRMPAFQARLNDGDILAVIAFIKARLPVGLRGYTGDAQSRRCRYAARRGGIGLALSGRVPASGRSGRVVARRSTIGR